MEKETRAIGFACLLGAFVGALISIEIATYFTFGKYFWFVGALIGGAVSYLAYDFKQVKEGVVYAYNKTYSGITSIPKWRPDAGWWRVFTKFIFMTSFSIVSILCTILVYSRLLFNMFQETEDIFLLSTVGVFVIFMFISENETSNTKNLKESTSVWFLVLKHTNPISFPFMAVYYTFIVSKWILEGVYIGMVLFRKFLWQTFVYIHSEMRVLCLVDATLGACVGYYLGSASIGAIAGCIFGIANYQVVSKWMLGVVKT